MQSRDPKPGKLEIINMDLALTEGFGRGVVAVFDVMFHGLGFTLCNLTLEYSVNPARDTELVVGYPSSPVRKRAPKGRQQLRLGMTPELDQEILTLANSEIEKARRKAKLERRSV